ncbi:MAG: PEP-CTERM sorting domain-containing protein, partial [Verrucomicrobia bacterium]|nr:PEP-CTERM sorting domain-containing protein [Verrucomicrobiota bacterium]
TQSADDLLGVALSQQFDLRGVGGSRCRFRHATRFTRNSWFRLRRVRDFGPFPFGPTVTVADVTFTGRDLALHGINSGLALYNFDSGFPMGISFANGTRAFGADFSSQLSPYYSSFTASLSLDSGEVLTFTASTDPNSTFFGFISPTPIKNLTFSDGGLFPSPNIGHQELIGNLYVVMEVPEPSVLSLFAFSALLLGWRLSRRGKRMG